MRLRRVVYLRRDDDRRHRQRVGVFPEQRPQDERGAESGDRHARATKPLFDRRLPTRYRLCFIQGAIAGQMPEIRSLREIFMVLTVLS